ncbi:MAG: hypothetical protein P8X42_12385, partial [Calditrichaceae bacterium]
MNKERWDLVQKLFDSAVDLDAERQDAYLKQQCAGNEELHAEVLSLLKEANSPHRIFGEDTPGKEIRAASRMNYARRLIDKTLGEYTITDIIASGGMGTIYRARRSDGSFEQEVAVKVIHNSLTSASFIERFRQERQILAKL